VTETHPPYPVRVDAPLPRWLVEWFGLIPHVVMPAFLRVAFTLDVGIGVLRWSRLVHCCGYAALGTDRCPPSTLADVSDHRARLDVPNPERLFRGLLLLVVGGRSRSRLTGMVLGSVALHCVVHASCPVLVVRPEPPGVVVPEQVSGVPARA
jgi:Universal stress protein family